MDIYRTKNHLAIWLKTPEDDIKLEKDFKSRLYIDAVPKAERYLKKHRIKYWIRKKKSYMEQELSVFEINPRLNMFESFTRNFEKKTRHRITVYNADVKPEQHFLYRNDLIPFGLVEVYEDQIIKLDDNITVPLTKAEISFDEVSAEIRINNKITDPGVF